MSMTNLLGRAAPTSSTNVSSKYEHFFRQGNWQRPSITDTSPRNRAKIQLQLTRYLEQLPRRLPDVWEFVRTGVVVVQVLDRFFKIVVLWDWNRGATAGAAFSAELVS